MWVNDEDWQRLNQRVAKLERLMDVQTRAMEHHLKSHVKDADDFKKVVDETKKSITFYLKNNGFAIGEIREEGG